MPCLRNAASGTVRLSFAICGFSFLVGFVNTGRADEADLRKKTSLEFIPADVSTWSSSLRLNEQLALVLKSKAVTNFTNSAVVKSLMAQAQQGMQQDNHFGELQQTAFNFMLDPDNRELVAMLGDALSQETFFFADNKVIDLLAAIQELGGEFRGVQATARSNPQEAQEKISEILADFIEKTEMPLMVSGFRLSSSAVAVKQLARLEALLQAPPADVPPPVAEFLKQAMKRTKVGKVEYLTFTVDGRMLPWDQWVAQTNNFDLAAIREATEKKTLTLGFGVFGDNLLVALGPNLKGLEKLGSGPLLVDRPELAPVLKHADKRLIAVSYVSKEWGRAMTSVQAQLGGVLEQFKMAMPFLGLSPEAQEKIGDDITDLAETKSEGLDTSNTAFSFLSARGIEGYNYHWAGNSELDGSKPLTLLENVGGKPLAYSVSRVKDEAGTYKEAAAQIAGTVEYLEANVIAEMTNNPGVGQLLNTVLEVIKPLATEFDRITREQYLPSVADGQSGWVLAASAPQKQWFPTMPAADKPLPMPMLARIVRLSDPAGFQTAWKSYFDWTQSAYNAFSGLAANFGKELPLMELPPPKSEKTAAGQVYSYDVSQIEIPKDVAFTATVGDKVAVFSLFRSQAPQLMKPTTATGGLISSSAKQPLTSAGYFHVSGMCDLAQAWTNYGLEVGQKNGAHIDPQVPQLIDETFKLIKCWRSCSSVSYHEGKAHVSHFEMHVEDAK